MGAIYIKYGYTCEPTTVKAYISVFVSITVKAVYLEMVSDLTTDCFISCLRLFIARRGLRSLITSDNVTNFVGAACELSELTQLWKFIPKRAPNFGGLWEATVKSFKQHF